MAIAGDTEHPVPRPRASTRHVFCTGDRRPSPPEAYGFVGSIAAAAAAAVYLVWTYAPEPWLRSLGVTYSPIKCASYLPSSPFVAVAVAQGLVFYMASNFLLAPPPACFDTIYDEHDRERSAASASEIGREKPIEPISDLGIDHMNRLMFGDQSTNSFIKFRGWTQLMATNL